MKWRYRFILIVIIMLLWVFAMYALSRDVKGDEELNLGDADKIQIVLGESDVTLHYEWNTEMTATVPPNPCNTLGFCD